MNPTVEKYLAQRSVHRDWPLEGSFDADSIQCIAVIPALAEYDHLFDTLAALTASSADACANTLVICVINNPVAGGGRPEDAANNLETLTILRRRTMQEMYAPLHIGFIDACAEDHALPIGEGVGLARKIGLDHGLHLLSSSGRLDAPLVCLDADAPPAPGFLDAVRAHYIGKHAWAGYAAYLHRLPEQAEARAAVIAHEIYMRYHEISLRQAGSSYAYPALGSIISCTGFAYAASGGMNRRLAGEDFYFMQQLTKTGTMSPIPCALVYPSGRTSCRTPFGTGQSVLAYQASSALDTPIPHPAGYNLLRDFFKLITEHPNLPAKSLAPLTIDLHPQLAYFLEKHHFEAAWDKIRRLQPDAPHRLKQFHVWFDGLRTIQLLHHLRDTVFPDVPARDALPRLLSHLSDEAACVHGCAESMLQALRYEGLRTHLPMTSAPPDYCPDVFLNLPATN